jgi:hypothetical protein
MELYFESSEHLRASGGMNGAIELAGYMDYVE